METGMLTGILGSLAVRSPVMIAWLVAIVIAIARWKKHPKVSMLVVVALAIMSVEMVVGTAVSMYLPYYMVRAGRRATEMGVFYAVFGLATSLVSTACWALLLAAIFGWRAESPPAEEGSPYLPPMPR